MQKIDATPGSLQNPVSEQFWDHFGRLPGAKSAQNRTKAFPKRMRKNCRFLACEKNAKSGAKRGQGALLRGARRHARRRRGGLEGCNILQKSAEIWKSCNEFWKDFMQSLLLHLARPRVRRIQTLRAFRRARLDAKMHGGLVAWMHWKCLEGLEILPKIEADFDRKIRRILR